MEPTLLIEVTRGAMVESRHRGHAVVVDAGGRVAAAWGDHRTPIYARSAIKALQAIPLIETGAADAFGLDDRHIALACASHSGEPMHTDLVRDWLARIGCTPADLECGAHLPYHRPTAEALLAAGGRAETVHNNCSGKHCGMLSVARHKGEPIGGYVKLQHPVQQRILGVLEQMTGQDLTAAPKGIDGCAIPVIAIPLDAVAYAMARVANPIDLPEARAAAVARIRRAWGACPDLVAGTGAFDTRAILATGGRALVKGGAEGVSCAALSDLGLGIAVKIEDGAGRAAQVAMAEILRRLDVLRDAADLAEPPVLNRRRDPVGAVRPAKTRDRPRA